MAEKLSTEQFRSLQAQIASGPADQVITLPGTGSMRVRRSPEPGVSLSVESLETHEGFSSTNWDPTESRPGGYPADVPFLPRTATMVMTKPGSTTLQWFKAMPDHDAVIVREMTAAGWVEAPLTDPTMPGMTIRPFRRGDRQRILIRGGEFLSLLDTRAE